MKRSSLPTQKGTDLFPNVLQAPTKLVIRGVPAGSPLYNVVARQFSSHLKQFHGKQQQAYALSSNQIHRGYVDWGDARAKYTNIQGQELLELEVDQSVIEEINKRKRRLPSWAIARFEIPNIVGSFEENTSYLNGAEIYAVLRAGGPHKDSLQLAAGIPYVTSPWLEPFDILAFAGTASDKIGPYGVMVDPDPSTLEMELLVDLRPFWTPEHAPTLIIDIYASAERNDPNHLIGYFNTSIGNTVQDHWINSSEIGGTGEEELMLLQSKWDAAGLPHSQQSYFLDGLELVLNPDAAQGSVTFNRDGSYAIPPPVVTTGLPNFLTTDYSGVTSDGWRYMVLETDPASGLITKWGFNNLIWTTVIGDPFPTSFTLTTELVVHNFTINEIISYINNPYPVVGTVYGQVYFDPGDWIERTWSAPPFCQKNRWVKSDAPDIVTHPVIASNVQWPDEFLPGDNIFAGPPLKIKDSKYLIGTLSIDIESAAIGFTKV